MKDDIWIARASVLEKFDGKGMSAYAVSVATGITFPTVKKYAEKFGFDFSRPSAPPVSEEGRATVVDGLRKLALVEGMTRQKAAEMLGLSLGYVSQVAKHNNIAIRHASQGIGVDHDRVEAMAAMYRGGKTLEEIGAVYKVSRERVRQIISRHAGITAAQGGQSMQASRKREALAARRDAGSYEKHGCSYEQYRGLVAAGKKLLAEGVARERTPTGAFTRQKNTAKTRGIPWSLKLWDWWQIWQDSGKWEERGRGKGKYVMCRFGDCGAYEVGNVYIAKYEHNVSFQPNNPYRKDHPDHEEAIASIREKLIGRRTSRKRKNHDLPIGVTRSHKKFQAQISFNGKNHCLGRFETIEEAAAAYAAKRAEVDAIYQAVAA